MYEMHCKINVCGKILLKIQILRQNTVCIDWYYFWKLLEIMNNSPSFDDHD